MATTSSFLKKMRVNEQKLIIRYRKANNNNEGNRPQHYSHYASNAPLTNSVAKERLTTTKVLPFCFICGASDHVQTNSPGMQKVYRHDYVPAIIWIKI